MTKTQNTGPFKDKHAEKGDLLAEFNNGWLLPSSGEWEVNSEQWASGSGQNQWETLFLLFFAVATQLQWVTKVRASTGE